MAKTKKNQETTESPQFVDFKVCNIPVSEIHPSDDNPRSDIDEESVKELAESIRVYGILQPVTIRPDEEHGTEASPWAMVSGHRRLLACKMLGVETIPAIIRYDISDDKAYDIMIVENLQRKDLTPLDEAVAFKELISAYPTTGYQGTTVQELAARFGKSEKYIRGRLALNELVPELKECLKAGTLTLGAAIYLAKLTMEQQLRFLEEYEPHMSESDNDVVLIPMNIVDVKDFIEDSSVRIANKSFMEDPDEKWTTGRQRKCAGCPFNSESQGALFADMVSPGECSDESCMTDKILAYARHVIDYWMPNLAPANQFLEPGDVVMFIDAQPWFRGEAQEQMQACYDELKHLVDEFGSFNPLKSGGQIWRADSEEDRKGAIRVISLRDLVAGERNYMQYWRPGKAASDPLESKEVTHKEVYRRLGALYDKRQDEIYKALEPMSKTAVETWFATDREEVNLPPFLRDFIAYHLINEMSWQKQRELIGSDTSLKAVRRFMKEHSFEEVLKAAVIDRIAAGQTYYKTYLIQMIMEGCAGSSCAESIQSIKDKYQPKIDKLIAQLNKMGYDEYDNPLNGDDEPEPLEEEPDDSNEKAGGDEQ
jgi:ParB/RepB/Spo0J family partition protein